MSLRSLVLSLPLALLVVPVAHGQSSFATITGLITDPQGAIVPGATVVAMHQRTNYRYSGASNEAGQYTLANLLEGTYTVRVSATGFVEYVVEGAQLAGRDVRRIDARLAVGGVSTAVEVSGGATLIETESARISDVRSIEQIKELPIGWRRITDIYPLTAQVNGGRFAGSRNKQAETTMDGVSISNTLGGLRVGNMALRTESYQELRVDIAGNSAEYGTVGALSVVTQSGGNEVHGLAFDYYMAPAFVARNPFSLVATGSVQHIPGGLISGPVYIPKVYDGRNRTFFLSSLEFERFGSPDVVVRNATVPLPAWRGGDFSRLLPATVIKDPMGGGVPFAGNIIPAARLNRVATKLQERFYPLPNFGDSNVLTAQNFRANDANDKEWSPTLTIRLDHRFSDKSFVFARITRMHWGHNWADNVSPLITVGHMAAHYNANSMSLGYTHTINPSLLNEFRWGYASSNGPSRGAISGSELVRELGLTGLAPGLPDVPGVLNVNFTGLGLAALTATTICDPCNNHFKHSFNEQLSWFARAHSVKAGVNVANGRFKQYQEAANLFGSHTYSGAFSGFAYSDFLLGIPATAQRNFPAAKQDFQNWDYSFFVTDTYKFRPSLTLSLGLRYEYKPGYTSRDGMQSMFDIGTGKIVVPDGAMGSVSPLLPKGYVQVIEAREAGLPGATLIRTDRNNFAPRFSLAWRPWGNNTVFRSGFGIFYDLVPRSVGFAGIPFRVSEPAYTNPRDNPVVILPNVFPGSVSGPATVSLPAAVNPDIRIPYSMQYNAAIEHQRWQTAFRLSYVGTNTRQGVWTYDINQPAADTRPYIDKPRMYPNYPGITYATNGAGHQYHSLAAEVKRQRRNGLTYQAHYTLSRDIGDLEDGQAPENAYDRRRERGRLG